MRNDSILAVGAGTSGVLRVGTSSKAMLALATAANADIGGSKGGRDVT